MDKGDSAIPNGLMKNTASSLAGNPASPRANLGANRTSVSNAEMAPHHLRGANKTSQPESGERLERKQQ